MKEEIRQAAQARRASLQPEFVAEASLAIQERLMALKQFQEARCVGVYMALPHEVRCDHIAARCWKEKRRLCIPAWRHTHGRYGMAVMNHDTDLHVGNMRVAEPVVPQWVAAEDVDLIIVPGVAFDPRGARLGHGAGHYDRMLAAMKLDSLKVGICYQCQVFDVVPQEENDIGMDLVVTEERVMRKPGQ